MADEKNALQWTALGILAEGWLLTVTGKHSEAVRTIKSGVAVYRSTGATAFLPFYLSCLAHAHASLGHFHEAWDCIGDATATIDTTKERWCAAEINRIAGEIALKSSNAAAQRGEAYFERALAIARDQQAKSWELRAAMSMARLWHDQGKRQQAHDLLAPVYGWFTEGFDTLDLKQARTLLDELR